MSANLGYEPTRVLVVCQNYWPEPFNIHEMCEGLVVLGHSVTVLTGLPNYPDGIIPEGYRYGNNRYQNKNGVEIIRVGIIPRGENLRGINLIKRILNYGSFACAASFKTKKMKDFDAVLAVQFSPMFMVEPAIRVARRNRVPLIMYAVDIWPEDLLTGGISKSGLLYRIMRRYSVSRYKAADVIAVTSPGFEQYIREYLGVSNTPYVYLPQFAESSFEEVYHEERGSEQNNFSIVFAGNVGGNQALESVIEAMALLPLASTARLQIYGSGSHLETCIRLVSQLGVERRVIFEGRRPLSEMPEVYKTADVMLLSLSNQDNGSLVSSYTIPRKLQSYMAAGKPILAFASGVAGRIVSDAECGIFCEGENVRQLADAIVALEGMDYCELSMLGHKAKKYYDENFSKKCFFSQLDTTLRGVVNDDKYKIF